MSTWPREVGDAILIILGNHGLRAAAAVIKLSAGLGNRLRARWGRAHININAVTGSWAAWNQLPTSFRPSPENLLFA